MRIACRKLINLGPIDRQTAREKELPGVLTDVDGRTTAAARVPS